MECKIPSPGPLAYCVELYPCTSVYQDACLFSEPITILINYEISKIKDYLHKRVRTFLLKHNCWLYSNPDFSVRSTSECFWVYINFSCWAKFKKQKKSPKNYVTASVINRSLLLKAIQTHRIFIMNMYNNYKVEKIHIIIRIASTFLKAFWMCLFIILAKIF